MIPFTRVEGVAGYSTDPFSGRVAVRNPYARGFLEGVTSFEDTPYGRVVNLYAEAFTSAPGNLATPLSLVHIRQIQSDPVTGAFRFDNLYQAMTYTTIALDPEGLWDPAIKSGLVVTPY